MPVPANIFEITFNPVVRAEGDASEASHLSNIAVNMTGVGEILLNKEEC